MIPAVLFGVLILILVIQIIVCCKVKTIWKWFIPIGVIALIVLGAYLGFIVLDDTEPSWHAIGRSIVMVLIFAEAGVSAVFSFVIYIVFGIIRFIKNKKTLERDSEV